MIKEKIERGQIQKLGIVAFFFISVNLFHCVGLYLSEMSKSFNPIDCQLNQARYPKESP